MMTLRLWRIFYQSLPRHPLFWLSLHRPPEKRSRGEGWQYWLRQFSSAVFGILIFVGILALGIPLLFFSFLLIFAGGLFAGGNAAAGISTAIGREQEKGRFDLVSLSPPGMFGAAWALATRFLRTNRRALRLMKLIRAFHLICFLGAMSILAMNAMLNISTGDVESLADLGIVEMLIVVLLVGTLHLDVIQAVLMGALFGILAPTYQARRVDSSMTAVGMFLAVQLLIYLAVFSSLNLTAALVVRLGVEMSLLPLALFALIFVFLAHEIALYWIWRMVQQRLNLEPRLLQTRKLSGV
jgi:hypothetical protein